MNVYAWNFEPGLIAALTLLTVGYFLITGPLLRRWELEPATQVERNRFLLAMVLMIVALVSPIDTLSLVSLSMHMVQHLILMIPVAILLIGSIPASLGSVLLRNGGVLAIAQAIFNPVAVLLISNAILIGWHVPANYDLAVRDQNVHVLEHVMFIVGSFLSWWPVYSQLPQLPRSTPGALMIYLFFMSIPPTIIGALLTFAGFVVYPAYEGVARPWGMTAQADQELAGLIMWLFGGLIYFAVLTVIFFRWFNRPGDDSSV
jgi:putative membrane protein